MVPSSIFEMSSLANAAAFPTRVSRLPRCAATVVRPVVLRRNLPFGSPGGLVRRPRPAARNRGPRRRVADDAGGTSPEGSPRMHDGGAGRGNTRVDYGMHA